MKTRRLGWTDLELSTIGIGTYAIGGKWQYGWGAQDDNDSIGTIRRSVDLGINWIDTAPAYGRGHAEELIGEALPQLSEKPIIATKCGFLWKENGELYFSLNADAIRKDLEDSLRRLKIDHIDLYQIHWPNPDSGIEEAWHEISKMVKEGKIRYAGVCNFSVDQLKRIEPIHRVASLQPPYSMLKREIETDLLNYCKEKNIGVVVYSPLQQGILTGTFSKERMQGLPDDDVRLRNDDEHRHFHEPEFSINLEFVNQLKPIAEKNGRTVSELAIAWTLLRREVTSSIVGARKPSQIEQTASAGDWDLSAEDAAKVSKLLTERDAAIRTIKRA